MAYDAVETDLALDGGDQIDLLGLCESAEASTTRPQCDARRRPQARRQAPRQDCLLPGRGRTGERVHARTDLEEDDTPQQRSDLGVGESRAERLSAGDEPTLPSGESVDLLHLHRHDATR